MKPRRDIDAMLADLDPAVYEVAAAYVAAPGRIVGCCTALMSTCPGDDAASLHKRAFTKLFKPTDLKKSIWWWGSWDWRGFGYWWPNFHTEHQQHRVMCLLLMADIVRGCKKMVRERKKAETAATTQHGRC